MDFDEVDLAQQKIEEIAQRMCYATPPIFIGFFTLDDLVELHATRDDPLYLSPLVLRGHSDGDGIRYDEYCAIIESIYFNHIRFLKVSLGLTPFRGQTPMRPEEAGYLAFHSHETADNIRQILEEKGFKVINAYIPVPADLLRVDSHDPKVLK